MLTGSKIQATEGWFEFCTVPCMFFHVDQFAFYKHFYMYKRILKALIIDVLQFVMTHEVATDQSLACCWQDFRNIKIFIMVCFSMLCGILKTQNASH